LYIFIINGYFDTFSDDSLADLSYQGHPTTVFSHALKRCFRLSGVLLKALWVNFRLRYKIFIRSVILGELESSRIYYGFFVHFPKTLGLSSFPKIIADFLLVPKTTFLSNRKQQALNFSYHESLRWQFSEEGKRVIGLPNRYFNETIRWVPLLYLLHILPYYSVY